MTNTGSRCGGAKAAVTQRRVLTTVGAAVCIALYGAAPSGPCRRCRPGGARGGGRRVRRQRLRHADTAGDHGHRKPQDSDRGVGSLQPNGHYAAAARQRQRDRHLLAHEPGAGPQHVRLRGAIRRRHGGRSSAASMPPATRARGFRSFEQSPGGKSMSTTPRWTPITIGLYRPAAASRRCAARRARSTAPGPLGGAIRASSPNDPELNTIFRFRWRRAGTRIVELRAARADTARGCSTCR